MTGNLPMNIRVTIDPVYILGILLLSVRAVC